VLVEQPAPLPLSKSELKINRQINAYKDRVRERVHVFIDSLTQANIELTSEPTLKTLEDAI